MFGTGNPLTLDDTAHVIQVALTPVFLLTGIATLLNVFGTRLARVSDQADNLSAKVDAADEAEREILRIRFARLRMRSFILDVAVILAALGGIAICGAVLTLFVGALRDSTVASLLFFLFGLAIVCTLSALGAFGVEMLIASRGVRLRLSGPASEVARS